MLTTYQKEQLEKTKKNNMAIAFTMALLIAFLSGWLSTIFMYKSAIDGGNKVFLMSSKYKCQKVK